MEYCRLSHNPANEPTNSLRSTWVIAGPDRHDVTDHSLLVLGLGAFLKRSPNGRRNNSQKELDGEHASFDDWTSRDAG